MRPISRRIGWTVTAAAGLLTLAATTLATDWLSGETANVVIAGAAFLTAVASWHATARASDTAEAMRRIEHDRWRHEFAPVLVFQPVHQPAPHQRKTMLRFKFDGPAMHERVTVRMSIFPDGRFRKPGVTHGLTRQQIEAQVWGPYRFEPGIDGASGDGKSVPEFTLSLGQQRSFWLIETDPPASYPGGQAEWWHHYCESPVRVRVEITAGGETWADIKDVEQWRPDDWPAPDDF